MSMFFKLITARLSLILLVLSAAPLAAEHQSPSNLFDKIFTAYGGDNFKLITSFRVKDQYKAFRYGQSYSPDNVDLVDYHSHVFVDRQGLRKAFRWIRGNNDNYSVQHRIYDGEAGYQINHGSKEISQESGIDFISVDRRHTYFLDTALVMLFQEHQEKASIVEQQKVFGKVHDVIELSATGHPKLTLFFDVETHRLTQMSRAHWQPGVLFRYQFSNFTRQDGILYARNFYVTRGGDPFNVSTHREVEWNIDLSGVFTIPKQYNVAAKGLDFSTMSVKKLADNLYMAGKDWGFSVFYDAGDYFIGAGSYSKLTERFVHVKKQFSLDKPLKYQVVSHHHTDHMGGLSEAYYLGATLITAKAHVETIKRHTGIDIPNERFLLVDDVNHVAKDEVTVIDFPSAHSNHMLGTYFNQAELFFTADTYFSRQQYGAPKGYDTLVNMQQTLIRHGITPKKFAATHSLRLLTDEHFAMSLKKRVETVCPSNWVICP
ncbi:MBL fold metallo-hydrolase [Thalassotalea sediminis]|uniref:MBL fold metallo-hydrolase n=1 Tax=Thalassotalea sediminis TaxID=1759089 RepID=UPI0025748BFA|nr:hypothetical protein [Thalassotalea sediminis]